MCAAAQHLHRAQAGIKHVVFSTLEEIPKDVKDALPAHQDGMVTTSFEAKAVIAVRALLMTVLDTCSEQHVEVCHVVSSSIADRMAR